MRFSEFMQEWLYGEQGYYRDLNSIGKSGDFYTAVTASRLFGGSIAKRFMQSVMEGFLPENCSVVEIGAHQGYLLADIIQFVYTYNPRLIDSVEFVIVEPLKPMRDLQARYFQESFGDAVALRHVATPDELDLDSAFVLANEIFDAFPCEIYHEGKIASVKDFTVSFDTEDEEVGAIAQKYGIEKGEICTTYRDFAKSLADSIKMFEFVSFDYGQKEHRNCITARTYKDHETLPLFDEAMDLKELYQKADLTYDVHFQYLIDCFEAEGIHNVDFSFQSRALVDFGLLELMEMMRDNVPESVYQSEANKVKTLIDPQFMGERFKMVRFRKNLL